MLHIESSQHIDCRYIDVGGVGALPSQPHLLIEQDKKKN
jgi:hypothetical protein